MQKRKPSGAAVKGVGGKKGRSGRKSKFVELGLQSLLEGGFTIEDRQAVLQNLTRIAKGEDAKAAVSAATLLFGYTFGKPTERHEHAGKDGGPITLHIVYESE
jgi:D-serine dehydratase